MHARRKAAHKFLVQLGLARCLTVSPPCPDLAVGQTFLLGLLYRLLFDQQPWRSYRVRARLHFSTTADKVECLRARRVSAASLDGRKVK